MGVVFMPEDLDRGKRIVINNAIKDFVPDTKCNVNKLFDSWEGKKSEERLKEILGQDTAEKLLKKIDIKNEENDMQPYDKSDRLVTVFIVKHMTSKDLPTYRKVIENAVRNFSPDIKDHILKELDLEKRNGSIQFEERLKEILGQDKAESLLKEIKANKNEITNDEKEDLQNMFKDSLTFD